MLCKRVISTSDDCTTSRVHYEHFITDDGNGTTTDSSRTVGLHCSLHRIRWVNVLTEDMSLNDLIKKYNNHHQSWDHVAIEGDILFARLNTVSKDLRMTLDLIFKSNFEPRRKNARESEKREEVEVQKPT